MELHVLATSYDYAGLTVTSNFQIILLGIIALLGLSVTLLLCACLGGGQQREPQSPVEPQQAMPAADSQAMIGAPPVSVTSTIPQVSALSGSRVSPSEASGAESVISRTSDMSSISIAPSSAVSATSAISRASAGSAVGSRFSDVTSTMSAVQSAVSDIPSGVSGSKVSGNHW